MKDKIFWILTGIALGLLLYLEINIFLKTHI